MPLWSLCPARFFSLLSLGRTLFWYSSLIHSSPRCRQSGGEGAGLTSELAVTFVKFGFTAALFRIFFPCNLFLNLSLISSSFFSSCVCTQNYTILDFSQTCIKTWNEILLKSKNKTLKYLKLEKGNNLSIVMSSCWRSTPLPCLSSFWGSSPSVLFHDVWAPPSSSSLPQVSASSYPPWFFSPPLVVSAFPLQAPTLAEPNHWTTSLPAKTTKWTYMYQVNQQTSQINIYIDM